MSLHRNVALFLTVELAAASVRSSPAAAFPDPCSEGPLELAGGGVVALRDHSDNLDCTWRLLCPGELCPRLSFDYFGTEEEYDILRLYDGESSAATERAALSGSLAPTSQIVGTQSMLFAEFTSDDSGAGDDFGIDATFECTPGAWTLRRRDALQALRVVPPPRPNRCTCVSLSRCYASQSAVVWPQRMGSRASTAAWLRERQAPPAATAHACMSTQESTVSEVSPRTTPRPSCRSDTLSPPHHTISVPPRFHPRQVPVPRAGWRSRVVAWLRS